MSETILEKKTRTFRTSAWLVTTIHKSNLGDRYSQKIIELYNRRFERKEVK
jgi:hypothetical protein